MQMKANVCYDETELNFAPVPSDEAVVIDATIGINICMCTEKLNTTNVTFPAIFYILLVKETPKKS